MPTQLTGRGPSLPRLLLEILVEWIVALGIWYALVRVVLSQLGEHSSELLGLQFAFFVIVPLLIFRTIRTLWRAAQANKTP
jgi:hypothetical protein